MALVPRLALRSELQQGRLLSQKKLREAAILKPETELAELAVADEPADEELCTTQLALVKEAVAHLPARKQAVFRLCHF